MKVPDWMLRPIEALGLTVPQVELAHEAPIYKDWNHSLPVRSQQGAVHAVEVLGKLFAANLLDVRAGGARFREGDTVLVRGVPMRVRYVQDRRLMLELPPGVKFLRPEDGRPAGAK